MSEDVYREVQTMWNAKKPAAAAPGSSVPSAAQMRQQQEQAQRAQQDQNQRAFNRWLERKLFPHVDACLQASVHGTTFRGWTTNEYRHVSVTRTPEGVRVMSSYQAISDALEERYGARGYNVVASVITEHPDYDPVTGQSYGTKKLREPMYKAVISW